MYLQLIDFILKERLIAKDEKVLLAVSGGIDSVVMCHLFAQTDYSFGIAHCNFRLRGKESDGDALFVEGLAKQFAVPFYLKNCDASDYAKENKISIQMAARDLRFAWFEELCRTERYAVYATAHHIDDAIETYFINQIRGTGIAGLHGLLPKNGKLIHPLLYTTRKEIDSYIKKNKLSYREDSSNKSTKYLRNSLRHNIMPVLEDIRPTYRDILIQNMQRFSTAESIYLQKIDEEKQKVCSYKEDKLTISIRALVALSNTSTYLYEFIKPYGFVFSQAEEIVESIKNGQPGAQFISNTHVLLRDRDDLILAENQEYRSAIIEIWTEKGEINSPINLKWETVNDAIFEIASPMAFLDFDKLKFPLKLRNWEQGDAFYPLGMQGKKMLSDFFIDLKLNRFEKENTYLLLSGQDIVWVVGIRIDNRYRISADTKRTFKLELNS
jgi:tRNA(Ile)-lysidine synthase